VDLTRHSVAPGRRGVFDLHGETLPVLRLAGVFGRRRPGARECLVVVSYAGRRAGFAVDALLGERQVVIKPFSRLLRDVPGISGSTILGDGRVALILDVAALIDSARAGEH
jgi:two-component system chemotaxis sensor kinase CheA